jgi:hypothetical protein
MGAYKLHSITYHYLDLGSLANHFIGYTGQGLYVIGNRDARIHQALETVDDLALCNEDNRDFCRPRTKGRGEAGGFEVYDRMNSHFVRLLKKLVTDSINAT